jgi:hypothetical protein
LTSWIWIQQVRCYTLCPLHSPYTPLSGNCFFPISVMTPTPFWP